MKILAWIGGIVLVLFGLTFLFWLAEPRLREVGIVNGDQIRIPLPDLSVNRGSRRGMRAPDGRWIECEPGLTPRLQERGRNWRIVCE